MYSTNRDIMYTRKRKFHRNHLEGPAYIKHNGTQEYYENGKLNRPAELGPAVIWINGFQKYYEH